MATISLSASETDVTVPWGVDVVLEATLTEDDSARDISQDTIELTVRQDTNFTSPVLFTVKNGPGEHETPASGVTRFAITDTQLSSGLTRHESRGHAYAIRGIGADAKQRAFIKGTLTVEPDAGEAVSA